MFGTSFAVAVTVLGVLASFWWFGVHRRRQAEIDAGVRSLANMKWRECVGLVLESLHSEGYQEEMSSRQPGDGGTEFLLKHDGETVLLSYKHGTAYRIGEANVRDFANGVQLQGAQSGMLITLGMAEGTAHDVARKYGVKLIDGASLWPRVSRYVSPAMLARVREEATGGTKKSLWIGIAASVALGTVLMLVDRELAPPEPAPALAAETAAATPAAMAPAEVAESDEERNARKINETARAMAEVASLTDEQRLKRRADAAAKVGSITHVANAGWTTQSTLVLGLQETDGKDVALIEEVCRTLTQFEELRYTRVQLDPPLNSTVPVRWRQCQ
jgi:restriction endonuclease Mrr